MGTPTGLRQRGAPGVQAIPGVEQARPSGVRRQTTHPLVHSAQAGPGVVSCTGARIPGVPEAASTAKAAAARATTMERTTARASSRASMDQP